MKFQRTIVPVLFLAMVASAAPSVPTAAEEGSPPAPAEKAATPQSSHPEELKRILVAKSPWRGEWFALGRSGPFWIAFMYEGDKLLAGAEKVPVTFEDGTITFSTMRGPYTLRLNKKGELEGTLWHTGGGFGYMTQIRVSPSQ